MLRTNIAAAVLAATFMSSGAALLSEAAESSSQTVEGDFGALYPAEGVEETYAYCASCHSTMLVAQQGQTREGWDELLVWMVEKQGMQPIPEEDRAVILDYLAEHYNIDRPHFPR